MFSLFFSLLKRSDDRPLQHTTIVWADVVLFVLYSSANLRGKKTPPSSMHSPGAWPIVYICVGTLDRMLSFTPSHATYKGTGPWRRCWLASPRDAISCYLLGQERTNQRQVLKCTFPFSSSVLDLSDTKKKKTYFVFCIPVVLHVS